jgi:peptidoglycan/xylan/chitin deacetylase (PgdA/CDA1 family)
MRRIEVLAIAAAVAVVGGLVGFGFKIGRQQASQWATVIEPEITTGAIGPHPALGALKPPTAEVAVVPPARPEVAPNAPRSESVSKLRCRNPDALGVSRVVEIDTTGGPGFGFEHFKQHDFLREKEIVLTFDDGPWPTTTAVLKALADECVLATFFAIGKHATYYPEILRGVAEAGHTVGSHTWSHQDLSRKSEDEAKAEIEKGISAVQLALGGMAREASFFRFPGLRHPSGMVTYLGERNIAVFSTDMDSSDFKIRKPDQIIKSVMTKLQKHGKGIVLMHDFQSGTSHAVPQLLAELKSGGYKIVHMRPLSEIKTLPQYDEELQKNQRLPTVSQQPTSNIVRDIQ